MMQDRCAEIFRCCIGGVAVRLSVHWEDSRISADDTGGGSLHLLHERHITNCLTSKADFDICRDPDQNPPHNLLRNPANPPSSLRRFQQRSRRFCRLQSSGRERLPTFTPENSRTFSTPSPPYTHTFSQHESRASCRRSSSVSYIPSSLPSAGP